MKTEFQRSEIEVIPHEHSSVQSKKYKLINKDLLFLTFFSNINIITLTFYSCDLKMLLGIKEKTSDMPF